MGWFRTLISGEPHFRVGDQAAPYMLRWYLIPRNGFMNLYMHKFLRDDEDRALHDHPWWFVSLMICGRYSETVEREVEFDDKLLDAKQVIERNTPSIAFRRATHRHRVVLPKDSSGKPIPCWTIVLTGSKTREWGFWCPKGFVVWTDFVDRTSHGSTGKGCE